MFKQDSVSFPSFFGNILYVTQIMPERSATNCGKLLSHSGCGKSVVVVVVFSSCVLPPVPPPRFSTECDFRISAFAVYVYNTKKPDSELRDMIWINWKHLFFLPGFFNIWKTPFPFYSGTGPFNRRRGPTMFDAGEGRKEFSSKIQIPPLAPQPDSPSICIIHIFFFPFSIEVCHLLRSGVAALFGPQSGTTSSHVQSICDAMEIPHIETRYKKLKIKFSHGFYAFSVSNKGGTTV